MGAPVVKPERGGYNKAIDLNLTRCGFGCGKGWFSDGVWV